MNGASQCRGALFIFAARFEFNNVDETWTLVASQGGQVQVTLAGRLHRGRPSRTALG
jgi:hypothetical protein